MDAEGATLADQPVEEERGFDAGEISEQAAGLGEPDVAAVADGQVSEGLSDVGFPTPTGP